MSRIFLEDKPWNEIQLSYDNGLSIRDLQSKFKISSKTIYKARELGLFLTRRVSDAMRISHAKNPRDYSHIRSKRDDFINYRADCSFKFRLADYPNEFDFTLIGKYGWYKPVNKGNNLNGVSRDHAVSVKFGFINNLPAKNLAHPANCVLMLHKENAAKCSDNLITYEELLSKISEWDRKYNGGIAQLGEQ